MVMCKYDGGSHRIEGTLEYEMLVNGHFIDSSDSYKEMAADVLLVIHIYGENLLAPKLILIETLFCKIC